MDRAVRNAFLLSGGAGAAAASYWGIGAAVSPPVRRMLAPWVLSRVRTEAPDVALTFDDGPDPRYTERFIEALGAARATFFVLGERARRWPSLIKEIVEAGHEIACHGDSHVSMARMGPFAARQALDRAHHTIAEVAGAPPAFYRPAFGCFTTAAWIHPPRLGMRRTLWTAWARDWVPGTPGVTIAHRILRRASAGAIFLLHDSGTTEAPAATLAALPTILDGLGERGLRSVRLDALVQHEHAVRVGP